MSGSGYAVMSAAPHLVTTAALAPYGFCQTLFTQLNRFLPAHLFSGLYRPRLVSQFTKTGSFEVLNRQLNTILKISNYILAMSIAVFFVYGGNILDMLSRGKYVEAHGLMMLFLVLMLIDNHRQVLMSLCNIIERTDVLSRSSLIMPIVVPLAILFVFAGFGTFGMALALILPEIVCVGMIVYKLRSDGYALKFDLRGQALIGMVTLLTVAFGVVIHAYHPATLAWDIAGMIMTALAFVAAARLLGPVTQPEREAIERLVGRKVYVL
jgi:O-antigen/teichoic acid export membrane protein